ncbi:hypothetical protein MRX96_013455 [Rhipicephalus microplus]
MVSTHLATLFVCFLAATVVAIPGKIDKQETSLLKLTLGLQYFGNIFGSAKVVKKKCQIPDEDWEELVDQFLAKIPNEYSFPGPNEATKHNEVLAGFTVGDMTLSGLSYLKRYGTVRVYCKNGKPHVDTSMGSQAPVKMSIPWKYCGGKSGLLGTQANHVKICIGFDVVEEGGKVALKPVRVSPKWIESMDIKVEGAGEVVNTITK